MADPAYIRAFPGGVGQFKVGSNYGPTIYVGIKAKEEGCQQVLWLFGEKEYLTEAGTMNMFLVIKNKKGETELITPPLEFNRSIVLAINLTMPPYGGSTIRSKFLDFFKKFK